MRIAAVSDLHGHLPDVPDCDVLLIAGDIGLGQRPESSHWPLEVMWWEKKFRAWLEQLLLRRIIVVGVAGNHDFIAEAMPRMMDTFPWLYLCDSGVELGGRHFWGTPWQPWFGGWAFNAPEHDPSEEFLSEKFELIPEGTDILIAHSPPFGFHDRVGRRHTGSMALNRRIQKVMPKLVTFGHIHHEYGVTQVEGVTLANVSHTEVFSSEYVPSNPPLILDI